MESILKQIRLMEDCKMISKLFGLDTSEHDEIIEYLYSKI
jgi:hypothetical protein